MRLEDVDTPALLVDLEAYERNLSKMARKVENTNTRVRPHAKTHKCPIIAAHQIALGAVGVCCQKVSEAEAMVNGGVRDVLISNEVVGRRKLERLAALARLAHVGVCADDKQNIFALNDAALDFGTRIDVLIEIDVGMQRCGVTPGKDAVVLAREVDRCAGLRLRGIQAYHGSAQHIRAYEERRLVIAQASEKAKFTQDLFQREGLACDVVSGAGTGTHPFEISGGVYNELQVGSYIFMDSDYLRNLDENGAPAREFEPSLFVYTTVMSRPVPQRAVVDAGLKASSVDSGLPAVWEHREMTYTSASDEHGVIEVRHPAETVSLGDKIKLLPGHCDPTVNLYDWYVAVRDRRVEGIWPISARGALR